MKRIPAYLLAILLCMGTISVFANEKLVESDEFIGVDNTVDFSFTLNSGKEISHKSIDESDEKKAVVISFVNVNSDTSYCMMDDMSNSQWAAENNLSVVAVEVTGANEETLSLYRDSLNHAAVELVSEPKGMELAAAFAKEAGIDSKELSLPFTVILDSEGKLAYAMEGYRKPDLLSEYIEGMSAACISAIEEYKLFSYGWKDGIHLFWLAKENSLGYRVWRSTEEDGEYLLIHATDKPEEASYIDEAAKGNSTWHYKLEIIGENSESLWSEPIKEKAS